MSRDEKRFKSIYEITVEGTTRGGFMPEVIEKTLSGFVTIFNEDHKTSKATLIVKKGE